MATSASTTSKPVVPAKKSPEESAKDKAATYANGYRKAREEKGYGRVALAKALGITTTALWNIENNTDAKDLGPHLKALAALPHGKGAKSPKASPVNGKATPATVAKKGKASAADLI